MTEPNLRDTSIPAQNDKNQAAYYIQYHPIITYNDATHPLFFSATAPSLKFTIVDLAATAAATSSGSDKQQQRRQQTEPFRSILTQAIQSVTRNPIPFTNRHISSFPIPKLPPA